MIDIDKLHSIAPKWKEVALMHFFDISDPDGKGNQLIFDSFASRLAAEQPLRPFLRECGVSVNDTFEHYGADELVVKALDLALVMEQNDSRHSQISSKLLTQVHRLDETLRDIYAENISADDERIGVVLEESRGVWMRAMDEGVQRMSEERAPISVERGG